MHVDFYAGYICFRWPYHMGVLLFSKKTQHVLWLLIVLIPQIRRVSYHYDLSIKLIMTLVLNVLSVANKYIDQKRIKTNRLMTSVTFAAHSMAWCTNFTRGAYWLKHVEPLESKIPCFVPPEVVGFCPTFVWRIPWRTWSHGRVRDFGWRKAAPSMAANPTIWWSLEPCLGALRLVWWAGELLGQNCGPLSESD